MEKIQIVLASPSDLSEEREMIHRLVDEINTVSMRNEVVIDLRMWENSAPGINEKGPQGVVDIDLEIPKADIFICLYWKKVGTIIPSEGIAGTEHELNTAIDSFNKNGKPDVKVFFKNVSDDEAKEADSQYIKGIAHRLQPMGLYNSFNTIDELRSTINRILQSAVLSKVKAPKPFEPNTPKHIEVSTVSDLLSNVAPGNRLILEKGFYDILSFTNSTEYLSKVKVFDGEEAHLSYLSNFTIISDSASILTRPRYATVLTLNYCENIKFTGISFGHVPHRGYCQGAVIKLVNCKNVQFDSCEFFGCGTYGLIIENSENIIVNGSKIFECTYGAIHMEKSELVFRNSTIESCIQLVDSLIAAFGGYLTMNNVSIHHNETGKFIIELAELTDEQSKVYYSVPGIKHSLCLAQGVCIYNNTWKDLCNIPNLGGIFWADNRYIS